MRASACVACAKRKVRCDRDEPCSNCEKRSQDCVYTNDESTVRIKQLEELVKRLGGDPYSCEVLPLRDRTTSNGASNMAEVSSLPLRSSDAVIVQEENNETLYLETPIWRAWNGKYYGPIRSFNAKDMKPDHLTVATQETSVFSSLLFKPQETDDFQNRHPPTSSACILWTKFFERVQPVTKIFFEQEIVDIRNACLSEEGIATLPAQKHAFAFAIYLITVQSLPEADCLGPGTNKETLINHYQTACEQALAAYNFIAVHDLITVRTLTLYIYSCFSQNKNNGLWDAMGLLLRKAERLGLHRDGSFLNLSPYETERRRRVWWCIQTVDLASSSVCGATSISLLGDWDTKLPLNIEDSDISPSTKTTPPERAGLTSFSHCLWRYWILSDQRSLRGADGHRLGMSWTVDRRMPLAERKAIITRIENELNEKFLRFCDPIKSLDMTILIVGRAVINFFRRATLCPGPAFKEAKNFTKEDQQNLLETSTRMLEYDRALVNTPHLEPFQWHSRYLFPWSAFVHVLVDLRHETSYSEAEKLWRLVDMVHRTTSECSDMRTDRRKLYAAGLSIDAWNHLQKLRSGMKLPPESKPDYLHIFEEQFASVQLANGQQGQKRRRDDELDDMSRGRVTAPLPETSWITEFDMIPGMPMNFEDIDWMFWSLPNGDELFTDLDVDKIPRRLDP